MGYFYIVYHKDTGLSEIGKKIFYYIIDTLSILFDEICLIFITKFKIKILLRQ